MLTRESPPDHHQGHAAHHGQNNERARQLNILRAAESEKHEINRHKHQQKNASAMIASERGLRLEPEEARREAKWGLLWYKESMHELFQCQLCNRWEC